MTASPTAPAAPAAPVSTARDAPVYRLAYSEPRPPPVPQLDESQRRVVEHRGGPLLVLAGPGTGKTTTLVEAVVRRMSDPVQPLGPDRVLVLTFARKAAAELRERITARLGVTIADPMAWTFHAFCYALLRAEQPPEAFADPLRLLSGPEQDVAVRELLRGQAGDGGRRWPERLRGCLTTRGFADEVRALIARCRDIGVDAPGLAALGAGSGRDDWPAGADFLAEYLDVLDAQGALDYAELVHRAALLAEQPAVRARLRQRYAAVFVDEYQDTDPAQERLLRALAGDGRDLVVVGDPDQSIYAFRGAEVANILQFADRFPRADGAPTDVLTLRVSRRAGPELLAASRAVAARLPMPSLPAATVRAHRALSAAAGADIGADTAAGTGADTAADLLGGQVNVRTYPSAGAELESVADELRRAHLVDGLPWDHMAVLVRSGVRSVPQVRRVLATMGVPVEVARDELPLAREPAVVPLLLALRCAVDPAELTAERARALLLSPLGGADAAELRLLGRELRAEERAAAGGDGRATLPRASAELVREAVADPRLLVTLPDWVSRAPRRLGDLLRAAGAALDDGAPPEDALWILWSGTAWPHRLERASLRGGADARSADRDLDAVCALFDAAARAEQRHGHRGALNFLAELEEQQIPGDTLAERPVRGKAVRLLTAHRAKGLEWDLVAVVGVQEGVWPDLRRRGSLLEPDRLASHGVVDPLSATGLLAEERRLFYVAVTRTRRRLLVTAVASAADDGERPSRFLAELDVPVEVVTERPGRPLSLAGLVAELRAAAVDERSTPALRAAATARLAALAAARDDRGEPLAPSADPDQWWGMAGRSDPGTPMHPAEDPVRLSGSSLAGLEECPLAWFLSHEAHAESARSTALGFGSVLHVLADDVASGRAPADPHALMQRVDRVWNQLAFEAPWQSRQQRDEARAALDRFLRWHLAPRGRELTASEVRFEHEAMLPAGRVVLRGSIDRVETDADGRVHVIDFKTGRTKPTRGEVEQHPQLGVYQFVAGNGALAGVPGVSERPEVGGAELVQLRHETPAGLPQVQGQPRLGSVDSGDFGDSGDPRPSWVEQLLGEAVRRLLAEDFPPRPGERCERCEFRVCCSARPEGRQVVE